MPAKIPDTLVRVNWRVAADDLALLEVVFGYGQVNAKMRELIGAYCGRLRAAGWELDVTDRNNQPLDL